MVRDSSLSCTRGDSHDDRDDRLGRRRMRLWALSLATLVLVGTVCPVVAAESPLSGSIQGVLSLIWGDGSKRDQRSLGPVATVTDSVGHVVELILAQAQTAPLGGLLAFNGKQVIVQGNWRFGPSKLGAKSILEVTSIALVEGDVPSAPSVVSGAQPWVSVMCKFSDYSDEPKPLSYFQNMFGSTYPGLDHYWRKVSYDKINVVGSTAKGWFVLPYPRSHYVDGSGNADIDAMFADCTAVADSQIYYPSYVGINLMFNRDFGPFAWGGSRWAQLDGTTRIWRVTWEPPWGYGNVCVMSHEMGHGFGFPHSAFNPSTVYDNAWDVMSDTWSYTVSDPTYGSVGQETISYHKAFLAGWLSSQQREDIGVGTSDTVTLERIAEPSKLALEMVRLPIGGSSTHFYTVEARKKNGYDLSTPGSAVIIHEVDTGRTIPALVQGTNGASGAMWPVEGGLRDAAHGIGVAGPPQRTRASPSLRRTATLWPRRCSRSIRTPQQGPFQTSTVSSSRASPPCSRRPGPTSPPEASARLVRPVASPVQRAPPTPLPTTPPTTGRWRQPTSRAAGRPGTAIASPSPTPERDRRRTEIPRSTRPADPELPGSGRSTSAPASPMFPPPAGSIPPSRPSTTPVSPLAAAIASSAPTS